MCKLRKIISLAISCLLFIQIFVFSQVHTNNLTSFAITNQDICEEMTIKINKLRAAEGLEPLMIYPFACDLADIRSNELVSLFSHTRPDGSESLSILNDYNVNFRYAGENVACEYTGTVDFVLDLWMNSDGHRENILYENFTHIGIGCVKSGRYYYWTQIFLKDSNYPDEYLPVEVQPTESETTTEQPTTEPVYAYNVIPGDVNNDSCIDNMDLILLKKYLDGECALSTQNYYNADCNNNGTISIIDVMLLSNFILNLNSDPLPNEYVVQSNISYDTLWYAV